MTAGINFEADYEHEAISSAYSYPILDATEHDMDFGVSEDITVTCTAQDDSAGVGLWQWVVMTADKRTQVESIHTVCRYGENYNKPPKCPWNACLDGECLECVSDWRA